VIEQDLKNALNYTMEVIDKNGAKGDAILSCSKGLSLNAQKGQIDQFKSSQSQVLGVRVIKDDRVGLSYSEKMDRTSIEQMVKMALENAKLSTPNPDEKIMQGQSISVQERSEILKREPNMSLEAKMQLSIKLETEPRNRDARVDVSPYNGVSETEYQNYYMNSFETFCFQEERSVSCYTSALMKDAGINSLHYHSMAARTFQELDWKKCIDESLLHASHGLTAKAIATGEYQVIFDLDELGSLIGRFGNIYSGKASKEKMNPMLSQLGQKIFDDRITIIDDPINSACFTYSPFDDEGMQRQSITLIENGVYKNICHNSATAKHFNTRSNARASRSARSSLGTSPVAFRLGAGQDSDQSVQKGEYFFIQTLKGHSAEPISGDFAFEAAGYLMRDGEKIQAVKGVTIAGNFYKMMNSIAAIGNQIHANNHKTFFAPMIRFHGMKIAGA
jgi:PmbA protein